MKIETVKPHQLCYVVYLSIFSFFILTNWTTAGVREKLGLVAHWTFDKGTLDAKMVQDNLGKNNGLIVGKPKIQKGVHSDALNFNGTVDFVKITEDIFFASISIEAVINPILGTRNPIYDKSMVSNCWIITKSEFGYVQTLTNRTNIGRQLILRFLMTASGTMSLVLLRTRNTFRYFSTGI